MLANTTRRRSVRSSRRHPPPLLPACALLGALSAPSLCAADASVWSTRAGSVDANEQTTWCTPSLVPAANGQPASASSRLQRIALDGTRVDDPTDRPLSQQLRLTCSGAGGQTTVTSATASGRVSVQCPADKPNGSFLSCRLSSPSLEWYVYKGTDCGTGLPAKSATSVASPSDVRVLGQMTGGYWELPVNPPFQPPALRPQFNDTCGNVSNLIEPRACSLTTGMGGMVGGTDLGFSFLGGGRLHFGFGDTWAADVSTPILLPTPVAHRGSVLFRSDDKDPADGIKFADYERTPAAPRVAMEVIESPHDPKGEISAINLAGFSLRESGHTHRFLFFATIQNWTPGSTVVNYSTLAWSVDGKVPFQRADRQTQYPNVPRWSGESSFGAGTIWVDRENGWIYLFGVRPYLPNSPVRLARVRARVSAVLDASQYSYWSGNGWSPRMGDAVDIISADINARPEISVAYSPHANRWIMLLVSSPKDAVPKDGQMQIWQSPPLAPGAEWSPAGKWEQVQTVRAGGETLPATPTVPGLYGPYTGDHLLRRGGRDVYFLMSQWSTSTDTLWGRKDSPYNVGLWRMTLDRLAAPGCPAQ